MSAPSDTYIKEFVFTVASVVAESKAFLGWKACNSAVHSIAGWYPGHLNRPHRLLLPGSKQDQKRRFLIAKLINALLQLPLYGPTIDAKLTTKYQV